jgi:hypothetical protein
MHGQPLLDQITSDSSVDQEFDAIGLDVDAVAVAARLKGDDFHGTILPETGETMALFGCQKTTNPAEKRGQKVHGWVSEQRDDYEERISRSSLQVSGWVLHDLPSISGWDSNCCQSPNEAYHDSRPAVRKKAFFAVEIPKSPPHLPV